MRHTKATLVLLPFLLLAAGSVPTASAQHSVARLWNEALLEAIREDFARPTVHARNLFHTSVAMYDAWAAYDDVARPFMLGNAVSGFVCESAGSYSAVDVAAAREEAISYAAYRLLRHRFFYSPGAATTLDRVDSLFTALGYDPNDTSTDHGSGSPAALGNRGSRRGSLSVADRRQIGQIHTGRLHNPLRRGAEPVLSAILPGPIHQ